MFTIIVGGILFIIALYVLFGSKSSSEEKPKEKKKSQKKETKKIIKEKEEKNIKKEIIPEKTEPKIDLSKYLFKTIKECNNMSKCYFYKNGRLILFCDEKK